MIERALDISGWMNPRELTWLAQTAVKSKVAIEIGSYFGRSARAIGDNIQDRLYCVDPWSLDYFDNDSQPLLTVGNLAYEGFCRNLADLIDRGKVVPVRTTFKEFNSRVKPDFIFIDGDHRREAVEHDIEKSLKMLSDGGILAGHDYAMNGWPAVKEVVDEHFPNVNVIQQIWWTVKNGSESNDCNSDSGIR